MKRKLQNISPYDRASPPKLRTMLPKYRSNHGVETIMRMKDIKPRLTDSINDWFIEMNIHIRANCEHFDQICDAWNEDRRCDGRIHASGIYGAASCSITSHGWHGWGGEENRELEPATTFSVPRGEYFCVLLVEELSILVIRDGGRWSGGGEQPPLIHRIDDDRVARNRVSSFASKNRILLKRNAYFPLLISISFSSFLDLVTSFCW